MTEDYVPVLLQLLDDMVKDRGMKPDDYNKIIEIMANALVQAQYDENRQELPR